MLTGTRDQRKTIWWKAVVVNRSTAAQLIDPSHPSTRERRGERGDFAVRMGSTPEPSILKNKESSKTGEGVLTKPIIINC